MRTPETAEPEGQSLRSLLRAARRTLVDAGIPSPEHDARALARHALEQTDGGTYELVTEVSAEFEDLFDDLVERRATREPLQLILGEVYFHQIRLATGPGVFIPRPETEQVAEAAIHAVRSGTTHRTGEGGRNSGHTVGVGERSLGHTVGVGEGNLGHTVGVGEGNLGHTVGEKGSGERGSGEGEPVRGAPETSDSAPLVVDLCAGSGSLAIAIARAVPEARVWAVEVDPTAAQLAHRNAEGNGTSVVVLEGDAATALHELDGRVDVVVANPPYIPPDGVPRDPEVHRWDPPAALYGGGEDGLDVPRAVAATARRLLRPGGTFVMEHGDIQGAAVRRLVESTGGFTMIETRQDLTGRDRFVMARREREERR